VEAPVVAGEKQSREEESVFKQGGVVPVIAKNFRADRKTSYRRKGP
jgi:hypothetical protein